MTRYLASRLSSMVLTLLGVSMVTFLFLRLIPGDPVLMRAGERGMSEERYQQLIVEFGLDQPLWRQYLRYLGDLLRGDFGLTVDHQRVLSEFAALFPATAELSFFALLLAVAIGLPIGIIAGVKRGSKLDMTLMAVSLSGYSMPVFWWGLLLIVLFSGALGWTPVAGRLSVMYYVEPVTGFMVIDTLLSGERGAFASALQHLILPAVTLAVVPLAIIARQTRSSILEVLGEEYIRTARSKGLPERRVIGIHALRNALIPVVTVIGLSIGALLGGAIMVEIIFAWPGVGKWVVDAVGRRDYQTVQGAVILLATIVILVNFAVDVLYAVIDPRMRSTESR